MPCKGEQTAIKVTKLDLLTDETVCYCIMQVLWKRENRRQPLICGFFVRNKHVNTF